MSDEAAFALLDYAIELGATHWDSRFVSSCTSIAKVDSIVHSDFYGGNEALLGRYFKARPGAREKVFLSTKFGAIMGETGFTIRGDHE